MKKRRTVIMIKENWNNLTNGEKAWMLGQIMHYMNDEEVYYCSGWLYIWPDGETYEQCMDDFESDEAYKELEESFITHYSDEEAHDAGLYSSRRIPTLVIEAAHYWDEQLGLEPIEVIK
jgi:hypothetical protein